MYKKKMLHLLMLMGLIIMIAGCAPKEGMLKVDTMVAHGDYKGAALASSSEIDVDDRTQRDNLLWSLNAGLAYRFAHDENASIKAFDESEWLIKYYEQQLLSSDLSQGMSSLLVNDTTMPYMGTQYDGVMANTYKALSYMSKGDNDAARVEFNRAIDRQRRAKAYYAKLIEKNREAIEKKEKSDGNGVDTDNNMPAAERTLQQKYPSLYNFEAYPDFINPMVSYMAGIFALKDGDRSKAFDLLKEAYGMNQNNSYIKDDLAYVDALLSGGVQREKTHVWIIIEDGLAPVKKEWRMDVPVWIFSNNLSYVSLALPKIYPRSSAFESYSVLEDDKSFHSQLLSDMDRVVLREFKEAYPAIMRRALLSATTKAIIQYQTQRQAQNSDGNAGLAWAVASLATTIYTIASTQADTRSWTTLPKRFDLISLERPDDGLIHIKTNTGLTLPAVNLSFSEDALIYVKMSRAGAKPSISVIPMGRP